MAPHHTTTKLGTGPPIHFGSGSGQFLSYLSFHVTLWYINSPECLATFHKSRSLSQDARRGGRRFQQGEGPSRGLLRDCETGCGTDWSFYSTTKCTFVSTTEETFCIYSILPNNAFIIIWIARAPRNWLVFCKCKNIEANVTDECMIIPYCCLIVWWALVADDAWSGGAKWPHGDVLLPPHPHWYLSGGH